MSNHIKLDKQLLKLLGLSSDAAGIVMDHIVELGEKIEALEKAAHPPLPTEPVGATDEDKAAWVEWYQSTGCCGHNTDLAWHAGIAYARQQHSTALSAARAEVAQLKDWKDSALEVMAKVDLQAVGKEMGLQPGTDIPPCILPYIRNLHANLAASQKRADGLAVALKAIIDAYSPLGKHTLAVYSLEVIGMLEALHETVTQSQAALAQHDAEGKPDDQDIRTKYFELLYAVEAKWDNETRHETALRYIRERENSSSESAQQSEDKS